MIFKTRRRTDVALAIATTAGVVALAVTLTWPGAGADTAGTPDPVTRAKVGAGNTPPPAIAPPGPLIGIVQGTTVHIHSDAGTGSTIAGVNVRLCRTGVEIAQTSDFFPTQGGNCIPSAFVATGPNADDSFKQQASTPPNTSVDVDFRIGTGTKTFTWAGGTLTATITCDETHPCALWVDHNVDPAVSPDGTGHVFKHFDVFYGASTPSSTTIPAATSTSLAASTTTVASGPTTTALSATTTSTTASASTTTTGTPGSTTSSTTPGSTDLTLSPSTVAPGATVQVTSPGWKPSSDTEAALRSDPVDLGKLTADASGAVDGSLTIPSSTPAGDHTLELTGTGADGVSRTVSASLTVGDLSTSTTVSDPSSSSSSTGSTIAGTLARTGFAWLRLTVLANLLGASGTMLVILARRQRRRIGRP